MSVFVCLFPNSSETAHPYELKFWGLIPLKVQMVLGYKNIRIRRNVSRKIKKD